MIESLEKTLRREVRKLDIKILAARSKAERRKLECERNRLQTRRKDLWTKSNAIRCEVPEEFRTFRMMTAEGYETCRLNKR